MTDLFLGYPDEGITNWIKENCVDYSKIPLCFEALEDGNVKLIKTEDPDYTLNPSLLYSFDNKTWNDWDYVIGTDLKQGEKLYLKTKKEYDTVSHDLSYITFLTTNKFNICGNLISLIYNDFIDKKTIYAYSFWHLFNNCTRLINASNLVLPATILTTCCYDSMFNYCTGLVSAPELPATKLANGCYDSMFNYCTGLVSAPELPATTLASACYNSMFYNCSNISELHYPASLENDSTFKSMYGSPWFGATNATIYYDL